MMQVYPIFSYDTDSQESDKLKRINWEQMSDPMTDDEFSIIQYNNAEEPPLVQIPPAELPPEFIDKQRVAWNQTDEVALRFLQGEDSVLGCLEYDGCMTWSARELGRAVQQNSKVYYLPLFNF